MGSIFEFHTAGKIYAVGAQSRWGGIISVFEDGALKGSVNVIGTDSTDLTIQIKYTKLVSPLDVDSNSTYRIIFKGMSNLGGGGYSYFSSRGNGFVPGEPMHNSHTGNISWMGGSFIGGGSGVITPELTTNTMPLHGYGTTDIIFGPA